MRDVNLRPPKPEPREFTICRNQHGRWLAIEDHGLLGGVFTNRKAAERFALDEAGGDPHRVYIVPAPDTHRH